MKQILLFAGILCGLTASAQELTVVVPIVASDLPDGMGRGMVYSELDSSLVKGNYIDSAEFRATFEAKEGQHFFLKLAAPGYMDTIVSFKAELPLMQFSPVLLTPDVALDAVQVVYEKPVFERTMKGLSVNVKGTTLEQLNTLFDVLKASPKITSPDGETIEIIGRGTPLILVDRQPIISTDELRAIPASEVDKIEIITNPSAKYRAQGSGNGVIEVYTNSFSLQGYRAHVRVNGGLNTQLRPQGGLNAGLNIKKGKFSLNGYLGGDYNATNSFGASTLTANSGALETLSDWESDQRSRWQYYRLKMGYDFKENQRISFGGGGHGSIGRSNTENSRDYRENDTILTRQLGGTDAKWKWLNNSAFVNYTWETDTLGSSLEANLNYTGRVSDRENEFNSEFFDFGQNTGEDYHALATSSDRPHVFEFRLNYEHYLDTSENKILELGADASALFNTKRFNRYNRNGIDWQEDTLFTNSYNYQEQIAGAYVQYSQMFGKLGFQVGLRGEFTRLDGYSRSLNQQFMDSSFVLPFPNAGMLFEPSEKVSITLYYETGIDRPSFSNYDPFVRILDSLNVEMGNPFLRPSYNHTIGFELDLFYSYNFSFSYSRYNDVASTLTFINPETFVTSSMPWNAKFNETYSFSLSLPFKLDWLDGWNSLWLDYNTYEFTNEFQRDPFSNITFGLSSWLTFKLPQNFAILNSLYLNQWGNDMSVSRVNRRWTIRLTKEFDTPDLNVFVEVNNIFPNVVKMESVNGNYRSASNYQDRFTGFRVGLFYKFGKLTAQTNIQESSSGQSDRF
jgi:hypothetical protein